METRKLMKKALKNRNVKFLIKAYFGFILTPIQQEIVRKVTFKDSGRLNVCAMTRYGKSFCVALGIALYILLNENKRICFVAPTREQAGILRDYMAELVVLCDDLYNLAHLELFEEGEEKLKKEASKTRLTFRNGCEYRIFTAHNEGKALMGFGVGRNGGKIVKDEATMLSDEAQTKIARMMGDNPEKTQEIELFNPWDRDNRAFEHWVDKEWDHIHVPWKKAVEEGRATEEFIKEKEKELTPLEFSILYKSEFPMESEDSVFNLARINEAKKKEFDFVDELNELAEKLERPERFTEFEFKEIKKEAEKYKLIISCDPADMGLDYTIILWGIQKENKFKLMGYYSEPKSDPMGIVGKIKQISLDFFDKFFKCEIHVDRIGIGTGPLSRLKEIVSINNWKHIKVIGCHFGEQAVNKDHYANKKAENYFRLKAIFDEGLIDILDIKELTNELISIKWKLTSSDKKRIEDPDKSPDWADALVYLVWKDKTGLKFGFV